MALPDLLRAIANFRKIEQPEWFAHVHPHGHATARLARRFAAACGKAGRGLTLDEIELGAHMHDVGKYLIGKSIILKPGPLDAGEWAAMSLHPVYGAQILRGLSFASANVHGIALYHHERWDGSGYPEGLSRHRIPPAARIVSIADVYTSLRARRSYKPTRTRAEACAELEAMAGRELDPYLVEDFLMFVGRHADGRPAGRQN